MSILLADRILGGSPLADLLHFPIRKFGHRPSIVDAIQSAEIIDFSNITKYQWENNLLDQWGMKTLFNVMPPFDSVWMDTSNEGVGAPSGMDTPLRSGVLLTTKHRVPITSLNSVFNSLGTTFDSICDHSDWETASVVQCYVFQFHKLTKPIEVSGLKMTQDFASFNGFGCFAVLPNGKPLTGVAASKMQVHYEDMPPHLHSQVRKMEMENDDQKPLVNEILSALFAIQFMHCKNVRVKNNEQPKALNKSWQKRKGCSLLTYKTLEIEPMKRVLETEGGLKTNGIQKALHICRGHFATYTPEKGMLGRKLDEPVTVWKPAHVRGSKEFGEVKKDYRVKV